MKEKSILDIHNTITPKDLEMVLETNVRTILEKPEMAKMIPAMFVWGPPGVGKSDIIRNVAKNLGIDFIDFRLSYRDPVDLHGMPTVDKEKNVANWIPFEDLPHDKNGKGIILFDEMSSVDKSLQNAALQLVLDRRIDKYEVPNGYFIVAAGNRTTDRAISQTMASSLSNRFLHFELETNVDDWEEWGVHHDIHPSVLAYIRYRPTMLHKMTGENLERGWPSPRSWERVSTMIKLYGQDPNNNILRKIVYGLVGNGAGVEFIEFFKMNEEVMNVKAAMLDENIDIEVPERPDAKYAIVSAMTYQLWKGKDELEEEKLINGFYRISMKFTADFATLALTSAMEGPSKELKDVCIKKLFRHSAYAEWIKKFGKALHKKCKFSE